MMTISKEERECWERLHELQDKLYNKFKEDGLLTDRYAFARYTCESMEPDVVELRRLIKLRSTFNEPRMFQYWEPTSRIEDIHCIDCHNEVHGTFHVTENGQRQCMRCYCKEIIPEKRMTIYYLSREEYDKITDPHWWGRTRGWTDGKDIYINKDAFYINDRDRSLLLQHEIGHIEGMEHQLFGVMSPYGLIRWLSGYMGMNI
jgi:hypothetical protein